MNGDGIFTISDVWEILYLLFFYPGDFVVYRLIGTEFGTFFEFSSADYGGFLSGVISFIVWGYVFFLVYALFVRLISVYLRFKTMATDHEQSEE